MATEALVAGEEIRTGFINGATFGYRPVRYAVMDGQAIFEGDIVLGTVEEMEQRTAEATDAQARGVVIPGQQFRWPGGIVAFRIDPALPDAARVTDAIAHWQNRTSIRFVERTTEPNFVTFRPGAECSSRVGMQGGEQFITLDIDCGQGAVIHEIAHAVGLWHEQSREDRDQFIRILRENIEPGKEHNFDQHITDGDDVGAYDFGSIMHYPATAFSRNGQPTIEVLSGASIGQRTGLSDGDVRAVNCLYFPALPSPLAVGVYTIQQQSNGRFMDAHEYAAKDFAVVTRPAQNNDTQRWRICPVGGVFTIQQQSNGRFMDAHEYDAKDFAVVTRPAQNNETQRWMLTHVGGPFTIQQQSNDRFLDAYEQAGKDFALVTRQAKGTAAQQWVLTSVGPNLFTVQQRSNGRFMDAHEIEGKDFALVTRPAQNNATQQWTLTSVGVLCTIQQQNNGRFLDAYEHEGKDFALVTRPAKNTAVQRWIFTPAGTDLFTIQQQSNDRFMDAHEIDAKDFALVTRPAQNNATQRWVVKRT